jgi:hypothetical protein
VKVNAATPMSEIYTQFCIVVITKILPYYYNQIDSHASRGYLSTLNFGGSSPVTRAVVESSRRFVTQKIIVPSQKSSISAKILSNFFLASRQNFGLSNCRIGNSGHASPPCRFDCNSTVNHLFKFDFAVQPFNWISINPSFARIQFTGIRSGY